MNPARSTGSSANVLLRSYTSRLRPSRRISFPAMTKNCLPAGHYSGLNVPCAHQRFGNVCSSSPAAPLYNVKQPSSQAQHTRMQKFICQQDASRLMPKESWKSCNISSRCILRWKSIMAHLQDFGTTYWGYKDSNGSLKFDSGSRPWNMDDQSSSSKYYADVISKMTNAQGNKGNVLRFDLFFDGRSAPIFDTHLGRDSITGLSTEVRSSSWNKASFSKVFYICKQ